MTRRNVAMFAFALSLGVVPTVMVEPADASNIVNDSGALCTTYRQRMGGHTWTVCR